MYTVRTPCHLVYIRTEMKGIFLAGIFSIALDSFRDSQNFFHAFMSLLVLY